MQLSSNMSLSECLKYGNVPEHLLSILEQTNERLIEHEKKATLTARHDEVRNEQLSFCKDFIASVLEHTRTTTKHKELVKLIQIEFENSFIEL